MAFSDTQAFLTDLIARFDPTLDLAEGSRAQTALIEPILARIGGDPFDDDIGTFIRARLTQVCPTLAIADIDELSDLLIDPMRVLLEPISREIQLVKLRMSLANVNALADDEVDALMGNFFESRKAGGYAVGVVRAYFAAPQTVSVTLVNIAQSRGGLRFLVPRPQQITAEQMLLNIEGTEYYFDVAYIAENRGDEYNLEKSEINSISNLPSVIRATNLRRFSGGVVRETSEEFVARVQQGASDRTLTTAPGIVAVLNDNFPSLRQVFEVGCGDPEMRRDILTGGSLGAIPAPDTLGSFFGVGTAVEDLDADTTTSILESAAGSFVSRLAAVGFMPDGWFATLTYKDLAGELVVVDAPITRVLSERRIRVDHQMPLGLGDGAITWMLRKRVLTVSSIPGGIAFPDTPQGTLALPSDAIHIGGKTDVYVAGPTEQASAQILGFTDERPLLRGYRAQTQGTVSGQEDLVLLPDADAALLAKVRFGMSLVLSEGVDAGAYLVTEVLTAPARVRVAMALTGTQPDLLWKIVDDNDVDLIQPKDVLVEGYDLVTAAGSARVLGGGINFVSVGVRVDDVLWIDNVEYGGDYVVTEVGASYLLVAPPIPRALSAVHYVISRRSEGLQAPVLRVTSLELLDSGGAPNGTLIPYRDPVLCVSGGFQNEAAGYLYDGPAFVGLVSLGFLPSACKFDGYRFAFTVSDPRRPYDTSASTYFEYAFNAAATMQAIADAFNAVAAHRSAGVRAVALEFGGRWHLGLTSQRLVTVADSSGSHLRAQDANELLGWPVGYDNTMVRGAASLVEGGVRRGDLVECASGNNAGVGLRVVGDPLGAAVRTAVGPSGPSASRVVYGVTPLSPDAGGRVRVGRPSLGSVRCYFLQPTSASFSYETTRFAATVAGQPIVYRPDPENTRTLLPPPPTTAGADAGVVTTVGALEDESVDFLRAGISEGDLLDVLWRPLEGTLEFDDSSTLGLAGTTLVLQLDGDPLVQISFPYAMTLADAKGYINAQLGTNIATTASRADESKQVLVLGGRRSIEILPSSTALAAFGLSAGTNAHPAKGTYVIGAVTKHRLEPISGTSFPGAVDVPSTVYRIRRHVQRVSSTEMNLQQEGELYYVDVECVSLLPGDYNNLPAGVSLEAAGYQSDGYRLVTDQPALSYSRAEVLRAQVSRSVLLVGSADDPTAAVQLNLQSVQVNYERSPLVDEVQSFVSSRYRRVVCEDILIRHMLPHYVSLDWRYSGGASTPTLVKALSDYLLSVEGDAPLEVGALTDLLRAKQASSVYSVDGSSSTGRAAPQVLVVSHDADRRIRAQVVRDMVQTVRMATYLPGTLQLKRVSGR